MRKVNVGTIGHVDWGYPKSLLTKSIMRAIGYGDGLSPDWDV